MTNYILAAKPNGFIRVEDSGEIRIVSNLNKATKYSAIGDGMRVAAQINTDLGTSIVRVIPL